MSLASEIDDLRSGLKQRMPTYGFFDGLAAALVAGFLGALVPATTARPRASKTRLRPEIRRRSISSRITHG